MATYKPELVSDTGDEHVKKEYTFDPLPENVELLRTGSDLTVPVNRILQDAYDADLEWVIITGKTSTGEKYLSFSHCSTAWLVLQLERTKLRLVCGDEEREPPEHPGDVA